MRLGVRALFAVGLAGLLAVAGVIAGVLVVRLVGAEAESLVAVQQRRRALATAERVAAACTEGDCGPALQRAVDGALDGGEDLRELTVLDSRLHALIGPASAPPQDPMILAAVEGRRVVWVRAGDEHRVVVPIVLGDGRRGAARFRFSLAEVRRGVAGRQRLVMLTLLADLVVVLLFGIYLGGRYLVRPIRELTRATERVAGGELRPAVVPWVRGAKELEQLAEALRTMVERLAAQRAAVESAQESLLRSEKLATVGRLAAGVAHEIGNPLAAVLGYVEYLRDGRGTPPELQASLLERMEKELLRMRGTVQELLDFSRPSPARMEPVSVIDVVRSAVELVRYQKRFKKIAVELHDARTRAVLADAGRLRQVLVNLLLNAADAIEGAGTIRVDVRPEDNGVRVSVCDEGPGVDDEARAHLFDPFYSTKPSGQGTGLGLAICQRLVEEAKGRIGLEEADPERPGATFFIWLPTCE